ncbi:MAG: hypothetical protein GY710_18665 [Desulfobacteraceae bacterium]|nr:hypothetical protein [Desulfobacteraceae bacterium]
MEKPMNKACLKFLLIISCGLLTACARPQTINQLTELTPEKEFNYSSNYECIYSKTLTNVVAVPFVSGADAFLDRDKERAWFSTHFSLLLIKNEGEKGTNIQLFRHKRGAAFGHLNDVVEYLANDPCKKETNNIILEPETRSMAKVFFYRVGNGKHFSPKGLHVYCNGKELSELNNYQYSSHSFKPDKYSFSAKWDLMKKPLFEGINLGKKTIEIDLKPGEMYFINYKIIQDYQKTSSTERQSIIGKILSNKHMESANFVQEARNVALQKLKLCKPAK